MLKSWVLKARHFILKKGKNRHADSLGYDIQFDLPLDVPFIGLVNVHPSRVQDLREPDELTVAPDCAHHPVHRFVREPLHEDSWLPQGPLRLYNSTLIEDSGEPDPVNRSAREMPVEYLPEETLIYLLGSRYCEVDLLSDTAARLFGGLPRGWQRVQAVCDWVHTMSRSAMVRPLHQNGA